MAFSSWIRNWKRSIERRWALYQTIRRKNAARRQAKRPGLEALEDRFLLSTYVVTNTNTTGGGSLFDAITQANNTTSGITEIDFNISGTGMKTITPGSNYLPNLTANGVFINGYSENVFQNPTKPSTSPLIEINGAGTPFGVDGLQISATGCTVQGLYIDGFYAAIEIDGNGNTIGGTTAGQGNVFSGGVSGNSYGVIAGGSENLFQGNYIGTNVAGTAALSQLYGIYDVGGDNTIGGTVAGAGNVISGNTTIGVWINTSGVIMEGNYIGLNAAGTSAVGNGTGIAVTASGNVIAGGNVISGNVNDGIDLFAGGDTVEGNYIGTDPTGTYAIGNSVGINAQSSSVIIGGTGSAQSNLISGNLTDGIQINANQVTVENNFIGTQAGGTGALGNGTSGAGYGVNINGSNNIVGTGNIIANNTSGGVVVGSGSSNTITQNSIYANGTGTGPGITISSGANNNIVAPTISSTSITDYTLTVKGTYSASKANVPYVLEFFGSPLNDPEGKVYVGSITVTPTTTGTQNFTANLQAVAPRTYPLITATLTDSSGNTSQFSPGVKSTNIYYVTSAADDGKTGELRYAINQANNTTSGITTIDFNIPFAPPVQSALSASTTGGSIAAGTYYYVVTAVTPGGETTVSNEQSITTTGSTSSVTVKWAAAAGATGYKIYRSTTSGVYTSPALITTITSGTTVSYKDTAASPSLGAPPSVSNLTISLTSALPALTASDVFINGLSQGGFGSTTQTLTVDGTGAGPSSDGFLLQGSSDVVSGLIIQNFGGNGVEVSSGANNVVGGYLAGLGNVIANNSNDGVKIDSAASGTLVEGNYIGTNVTGTAGAGNIFNGVEVAGSTNTVGGTTSGQRNVISGNINDGVLIDSGVSGVVVQGNYIGTDVTGSVALNNGLYGVEQEGPNNTIGGNVAGAGNLISGNTNAGVYLGSSAPGASVQGNYIGTDAAGAKAIPNSLGVSVNDSGDTIGGTVTGAGNVISGNTNDGVLIGTSGTLVQGNNIGTDVTGVNALGNKANGVHIAGSNNTVGIGNIISANSIGVLISSGSGNTVTQNSIFANGTGTGPGITVSSGANNNIAAPAISSASISDYTLTVKGTFTAATANVPYVLEFFGSAIGDAEGKVYIGSMTVTPTSTGTQNFTYTVTTTVPRNYPLITATLTDHSGDTSQFSNGVSSTTIYVVTSSSDANTVGTLRYGINQANNTTTGITTIDFAIGTSGSAQTISPATALPTLTGSNVFINGLSQGGVNNTIPLITVDGTGAGSGIDGLTLAGSNEVVSGLIVQNFSNNGIEISSGGGDVIGGGSAAGLGNVLSGNAADGVKIDTGASGNLVQGNLIGTNAAGDTAQADSIGVEVAGSNNTIGGTTSTARNLISGNTSSGVLTDSGATGNQLLGNFIGTLATGKGAAPIINFPNGFTGSGSFFTYNNGASLNGSKLEIAAGTNNEARSIFTTNKVEINTFYTQWTQQMLNPVADGMTFCIQTDGNNVVGGGGGSLGYQGLGKSVAIKFDLYNNSGEGTSSTGLYTDGATPTVPAIDLHPSGILLHGGDVMDITLAYDGTNLTETIVDPTAGKTFTHTYTGLNIASIVGGNTAYVGFTAGTGGANFTGYVFNWTYAAHQSIGNAVGVTDNGSNNIIGGTASGAGNVISGNVGAGLQLSGSGDTVLGNYIGADLTGAAAASNGSTGIIVSALASNNTIGGSVAGAGNVISGNNGDGVQIAGFAPPVQSALSTSTTGGSIAAGKYYYVITALTASGETTISNQRSITTTGSTSSVTVSWAAVAGATGYKIYRSTTSGVYTSPALIATLSGGSTVTYIDTSASPSTGAPPSVSTAGGASGTVVLGNYIGTDLTGTIALGNAIGVEVASPNNTIGSAASLSGRNVISGNSGDGVKIDSGASGVAVLGNYIGTTYLGSAAVGNNVGIEDGGIGNFIGGSISGARNVISGNSGDGVLIDSTAANETMQQNFIGTDSTGSKALGNGTGVEIQGSGITIGGQLVSSLIANDIAGNTGDGLKIDSGASGNQVAGNFIGIALSGTVGLANGIGVEIGGKNNTLGGASSAYNNVISGNSGDGVLVDSTGAGNVIQANYVGTDYTGRSPLGNSSSGIEIQGSGNIVGGSVSGAGNVISGNGADGVLIDGSKGSANVVQGNYIGINYSGTGTNAGNGVNINGTNNTVGGTVSAAFNIISGNTKDGVLIASYQAPVQSALSAKTTGGSIAAGTYFYVVTTVSASGETTISNQQSITTTGSTSSVTVSWAAVPGAIGYKIYRSTTSGVYTSPALITTITGGSTVSYTDTAAAPSTGAPPSVSTAGGASGTVVLGNYIGTNLGGTTAVANSIGVEVSGSNNTIGSTVFADRNIISGNTGDGVKIDSGASGNAVLGDFIGINAFDNAALGNGTGVEIGGSSNTLGLSWMVVPTVISDNKGVGVKLDSGSSGNTVLGSFIGTDHTGTVGEGNSIGVEDGGSGNIIGGSVIGARNVISGNSGGGVLIDSTGTKEAMELNMIGLDYSASTAIANGGNGVAINGSGNTIGGNSGANYFFRNYISGNKGDGVLIASGASGNYVQGNFVGIAANGTVGVGNSIGLEIAGSGNTVGASTDAGFRNDISGNSGDGVLLDSTGTGNVIQGNYIGTDKYGEAALGNSIGVDVFGNGNTIGGSASSSFAVISGNTGDGVKIESGASGNTVVGDRIGVNAFDLGALGNSNGIEVAGNNNTLGGLWNQTLSVVSGNKGDGVKLDNGSSGNVVTGSFIGVDHSGTFAEANSIGIEDGGSGNLIGGSVLGARNVISGNSGDGVLIDSSGTKETMQGNFIGSNYSVSSAIANGTNGVEIQGTANTIGGNGSTTSLITNCIDGNTKGDGIKIDSGASGNTVVDNYIGVQVSGKTGLANSVGLEIGGSNNTVGGTSSAFFNVISANIGDGVLVDTSGASNVIQGSFIGTDYTGAVALANGSNGLEIAGNNNTVGGTVAGARDIIAFNSSNGVLIDSTGSGDSIRQNSIFGNTGLGISLATGANNSIVAPTITSATLTSGTLTVSGTFTAAAAGTYYVEIFADSATNTQGRIFLGTATVVASGAGAQTFNFSTTNTSQLSTYPELTATLTDTLGDTSEFSTPFPS